MDKVQLRARGKQIMASLSKEEKVLIEQKLVDQLLQSHLYQQADTIGITISQKNEWNTSAVIEKSWELGKIVAVPKCDPRPHHLHFYKLDDFNQLETVFYGLQEPNPDLCEPIKKSAIDLIIVPGLLFDIRGYRIGYGGGYYDRYLSDYQGKTVALASNAQLVEALPYEAYDIPVDHLITEDGFVY
ncbi:5-formyltetrahydrofolate cyclo-ligase [Thalassobacillus devorans]|uniref:5-formyltetrahydrofolate cyclo-ligase n=1 Tax=Thalassobacillus devorans TaxID=279813 RepID=A0ABQ1PBC1_9BACI|nr:5-formyltetrahydrofolate cyclo-ligase [Thalassobacillus devorans]NIK29651.1 5-formyltetrahydrofolate cyclo-ligase [Thalassobacillus devorans]GGC91774.1 5-formyltetrahydrofolate cyclo-ligase [Thalassobacillus devorans]